MQFLSRLQIVVSSCCIIVGLVFFALNYAVVIVRYAKKRYSSLVPPLGGLCLLLSVWVWPASGYFWPDRLRPWSWLALVLDPGAITMLAFLLMLAFGRLPKSPRT